MSDPSVSPPVPKGRPWQQLAVIVPALLILSIGCCATGAAISGSSTGFLTYLGGALFIVGIIFLLAFLGALLVGFFRLLERLFSKGGS